MKFFLFILLSTVTLTASSQSWVSATPFPDPNSRVSCMLKYNGELYIGGDFTQVGGLVAFRVAKWNGTNWSTLGSGLNYSVNDLIEYNGDIYAATQQGIYKWDGISWSLGFPGTFNVLCIYNGQIAAAGYSYVTIGSNTTWNQIGFNANGEINALCVFNGELYYGSTDNSPPPGYSTLAKWDGLTWVDVAGITAATPSINSLTIFNNKLIAGGRFASLGGLTIANIAEYDGSNWALTGDGMDVVIALSTINNKLYIGTPIGKWSGSVWQRVFILNGSQWNGLGSVNQIDAYGGDLVGVYDILDYSNELFVAGNFYLYTPTSYDEFLVKLDGYSVIGIKEQNQLSIVNTYPNPTTDGQITISLDEVSDAIVTIRNSFGQIIQQEKFSDTNELNISIDAPAGIYFVQVESKVQIITKKIIKQ